MTKENLVEKLSQLEWEDFEENQPKVKYRSLYGKLFLHFQTLEVAGLY